MDSNSGDKAADSVDLTITTGDQIVTDTVTVADEDVKESQDGVA
jgi:hypothetical protein